MFLGWRVLRGIAFYKKPFHFLRQFLARLYLKFFPNIQVIAVTGSVGKTTTKETIAQVLEEKFKVLKTEGNLDPIFNIPITILKLKLGVQKLVLEMGVEYPHDMDFYLSLVKPNIAVVTKIYYTHTQFLGDIEGVIVEKSKMLVALPKNGFAVLNWDDENVRKMAKATRAQIFWYGSSSKNCHLWTSGIKFLGTEGMQFKLNTKDQSIDINFPLVGEFNIISALAAASVGIICGMNFLEIKTGLEKLKPTPHRMNVFKGSNQSLILDDTYNANPLAVCAALETLKKIIPGGRKIAVLGPMLELGNFEEKGHREVGKKAAQEKIDILILYGEQTKYIADEAKKFGFHGQNIFETQEKDQIVEKIKELAGPGGVILIKASHKFKFEEIVEKLAV